MNLIGASEEIIFDYVTKSGSSVPPDMQISLISPGKANDLSIKLCLNWQ
jgi:hypothetical protein